MASTRTSLDRSPSETEHTSPTTSSPQSLSKAVHARRAEYTRKKKIKIKIGSWNVAACPGTERDLEAWFVEGKGVDEHLSGVTILDSDEGPGKESVGAQEARRSKKEPTVPRGDKSGLPGGEEIGLYVLGLQEVVDLTSAREYVGRVYTDLGPTTRWRKAMKDGLPKGYVQIAEQQLSGLLLLIFASPEVAPTISSVSTVSVGTGIMGYLGNKGAVATRVVLGETTRMVFVNSHLASGSDPTHLDRRCWDVTQILQRTRFEPISWGGVLDDSSEGIGEEDFAFWFGDLNFRLDGLPGEDIRRLLLLHTKGEYDIGDPSRVKIDDELAHNDDPIVIHSIDSGDEDDELSGDEEQSQRRTSSSFDAADDDSSSNTLPDPDDFIQDPSQDPASLQATLDSLLPHDQLKRMQRQKKAFHDGWREGPITFPPTYKYDVGSVGMFDSSEKKRVPSWCDRIVYRTRKDRLEYEEKKRQEEIARIKDEEMQSSGIAQAAEDEDVLFDYNPDDDGADEPSSAPPPNDYDDYDEENEDAPEVVITEEGFTDSILQEYYTSHQRVLSSDHKPIDAVFTVEFDAVVTDLKAKVQQEVARELDRAENEGRPGITIIFDQAQEEVETSAPPPGGDGAQGVDFGKVAYLQRKTRSLTIANTSQVSATFQFVDRPTESGEGNKLAPPWLSVTFAGSDTNEEDREKQKLQRDITLEPGDAVNATVEIFVEDMLLVQSLNNGTAQLDDVLVLRVTGGRDHFLPIRGTWLQSCFGRPIDELIRIPEGGVRALLPRTDGKGAPTNRGQAVCWSAPRELIKLTETIETLTERVTADANMIDTAQLPIESAGWPFNNQSWLLKDTRTREAHKAYLLEALDSDKNLADAFPLGIPEIEKLEIAAEILIMFLNSITDGIVPEMLWAKLEEDINVRLANPLTDPEEIKTWVLDVLSASPNHNICFVFLTSMLSRVAAELAPVPKYSWKEQSIKSARSSIDTVRRSLSWKRSSVLGGNRKVEVLEDPAVLRRTGVENSYTGIWAPILFRGSEGLRDKEKKIMDDRRKAVLAPFLRAGRD
ncbi:DNase I-like protein [Glarea lozoyensis ATCC 20868]|uniref:DNase I-like protein n=1 Tax=Glarea lozoyensis (strain ATCC 20868 / MF5171) TaxID=1116229 RepID=S3DE93_GLAL2|nr:DNase I-like protein [Glarea lozoyensis ATCC 20868]EPE36080.1 DNase I-like protein [Glarea lozoyensis ATCC 20868]